MANTGDRSWGHLADTEHFGRACTNYIVIAKEDLDQPQYCGSTHAGHCMIYSRTNERIFGIYSARAVILMQMRFDGLIGFPGGLIDEGEDVLPGLNRELVEEMNVDVVKYPVKEENYGVTHWCPSKKLLLHFYALELPIDVLKVIEEEAVKAHDFGTETLGTFRVPLYTMGDDYRGFPAFLANSFAGNARDQLLYTLRHLSIMNNEEIDKALKANPV
ncbi:hypothetical protein ANN_07768 [Periplaneta americana]|uniref:U8 snoRNA-decapping enzyme n=1 Tax=Periplaneta americana TaxID=6978 RepID=A0ABQ8T120_PERAM|nr:hypothetical protein ANN_07768 [Periplaneta americana]